MTIRARLDKARLEVNAALNDSRRALYAIDKAIEECCDEGHEHPEPEDPPVEDPPHDHEEPADWVRADSIVPIASNFDISPYIANGDYGLAPPTDEAAFRMTSHVSHYNYDDAIVFPRQPGKAHLHEYFGNTLTDAFSDYASLRASGNGTTEGGPINRSSYWKPALVLGSRVKVPDYLTMYYKRQIGVHVPVNSVAAVLPHGMRMLAHGGNIVVRDPNGNVRASSRDDWPSVVPHIRVGDTVTIELSFPECWDGQHVDSPDHMAHVARSYRDGHTGRMTAPDTHPNVIPTISLKWVYTAMPDEDWGSAMLSSDMESFGKTMHADFIMAWDPGVYAEIEANALGKGLNCNNGQTGAGRYLLHPPGFKFTQEPNHIPLAEIGGEYRLVS